jgi:hypothetical protein
MRQYITASVFRGFSYKEGPGGGFYSHFPAQILTKSQCTNPIFHPPFSSLFYHSSFTFIRHSPTVSVFYSNPFQTHENKLCTILVALGTTIMHDTSCSDWEKLYFDEVWPNWKKNISAEMNIPDIGTYTDEFV